MSNQCPYCGSLINVCVSSVQLKYVCLACEKFFNKGDQPKQTLFDLITQSPEVLAEKLVYYENGTGYYHSTIVFYKDYPNCPIDFNTESEAIAATLAELKKVAK